MFATAFQDADIAYGVAVQHAVDAAVATRFVQIRKTFRRIHSEHNYDDPRCWPENLGSRFREILSVALHEPGGLLWVPPETLPGEVLAGKHDATIEETWHDAAEAAWWYRWRE
jgi:hypothetical protein